LLPRPGLALGKGITASAAPKPICGSPVRIRCATAMCGVVRPIA
jgi:hypothetical protein